MSNTALVMTEDVIQKVSKATEGKYSAGIINTLVKTSFPTLNSVEQVVVAFQTAKEYDLDPKMKEMYAWVDNKGVMTCIASAAGFMKIARKQPGFISIEAHAVYKSEKFELDTGTGEVSHKISLSARAESQNPIGAYAILKMKGKKPQVKFVNWSDYYVKKDWNNPWDKQGDAMIEKCGTTVLLRKACGLSGLYGQEEMDSVMSSTTNVDNGVDVNLIDSTVEKLEADILKNGEEQEQEEIIDAEQVEDEPKTDNINDIL